MLIDEQELRKWNACEPAFDQFRKASPAGVPVDSQWLILWLLLQEDTLPRLYAMRLARLTNDRDFAHIVKHHPAYIEAKKNLRNYRLKFFRRLLCPSNAHQPPPSA